MTDTFDFVVVGARLVRLRGDGRLSEDAATSVALLDAGGRNVDTVFHPSACAWSSPRSCRR
ncbi:hypothetical protein J6500_23295 [Bradyrhizobium sp. WSM 1704]|uniref:hypothetical protein n=1 Tax=Bradyrhizobium semiaridum TaxID=2821404 RepID=UPI001CE37AAA|nr:hypothetical protein [Bradyrhizobium semiaridum]MCA6124797.1 hypothetical protein [Bradyrhizobium semiaridum]